MKLHVPLCSTREMSTDQRESSRGLLRWLGEWTRQNMRKSWGSWVLFTLERRWPMGESNCTLPLPKGKLQRQVSWGNRHKLQEREFQVGRGRHPGCLRFCVCYLSLADCLTGEVRGLKCLIQSLSPICSSTECPSKNERKKKRNIQSPAL